MLPLLIVFQRTSDSGGKDHAPIAGECPEDC
jgi:hypothetical protein